MNLESAFKDWRVHLCDRCEGASLWFPISQHDTWPGAVPDRHTASLCSQRGKPRQVQHLCRSPPAETDSGMLLFQPARREETQTDFVWWFGCCWLFHVLQCVHQWWRRGGDAGRKNASIPILNSAQTHKQQPHNGPVWAHSNRNGSLGGLEPLIFTLPITRMCSALTENKEAACDSGRNGELSGIGNSWHNLHPHLHAILLLEHCRM